MSREIKIALTAIAAIVLLYLLINFMKGINVFKSSNTYYVEFADIQGLAVSNAVYANGYPVGIVRTIDYDYSNKNRVVVGVELDREMQVPEGTVAELESSLMGGVSMHLLLGANPTKHIARGDTIQGGIHQGALAQAEQIIPTVVQMVPKIDSIMANLNALTGDPALRTMIYNFAETSGQLRQASVRLNAMMEGDVPQMMARLNDVSQHLNTLSSNLASVDVEQTMKQVNSALDGVQQSLAEVQQFSKNINQLSADLGQKLNAKDNSLGALMNDRELYDNLNAASADLSRALQSSDSLLTDLRAHPKRYVHFSVFGKKDK